MSTLQLSSVTHHLSINDNKKEEKDKLYDDLNGITSSIPNGDVLIVMGYMNAKVRDDNIGLESMMVQQGEGVRNDNGERLVNTIWLLWELYS
jgi:hypothetical protein